MRVSVGSCQAREVFPSVRVWLSSLPVRRAARRVRDIVGLGDDGGSGSRVLGEKLELVDCAKAAGTSPHSLFAFSTTAATDGSKMC